MGNVINAGGGRVPTGVGGRNGLDAGIVRKHDDGGLVIVEHNSVDFSAMGWRQKHLSPPVVEKEKKEKKDSGCCYKKNSRGEELSFYLRLIWGLTSVL